MSWKLFLDDERYPAKDTLESNWRIARNLDDAMYYIRQYGLPDLMSLDHDLGFGKMTGLDFCKQFCGYVMDRDIEWNDLIYIIHSMNPVGAENMRAYLDNAKAFSTGQLDGILHRIQKGKALL
jgi:hypothetical protein